MIRKTPKGWKVVSKKGKNLGEYRSKEGALKRLRAIEYWKSKNK